MLRGFRSRPPPPNESAPWSAAYPLVHQRGAGPAPGHGRLLLLDLPGRGGWTIKGEPRQYRMFGHRRVPHRVTLRKCSAARSCEGLPEDASTVLEPSFTTKLGTKAPDLDPRWAANVLQDGESGT